MLRCSNFHCINWDKGRCSANDVHISPTGSCENLVLIPIPPDELQTIRNKYIQPIKPSPLMLR